MSTPPDLRISRTMIEILHDRVAKRWNSFSLPRNNYKNFITEIIGQIMFMTNDGDRTNVELVDSHEEDTIRAYLKEDLQLFRTAGNLYHFIESKENQYYLVAQDFFDRFMTIDLSNLSTSDFNEPMTAYIRLPGKGLVDADGDSFKEFFVYIGGKDYHPLTFVPANCSYKVSENIAVITGISDKSSITTLFEIPESGDVSLGEIIQSFSIGRKGEKTDKLSFNILKIVHYINCGNPDLREYRNLIRYRSEVNKVPVKRDRHLSMLNFQLVGYGWKKPRELTDEEWMVSPHSRMQRFGPGLKQRKRVYIHEHKRRFKKNDEIKTDRGSSDT